MVDPKLFARYRKALGTNADLAKRAVEDMLAKMGGMSPQQQAALLLSEYPRLVREYGKVAADVARQYYQESRDKYFEGDDGAEEYTAQCAQAIPSQWALEDVQEAANGSHGTMLMIPGKAVKRVMERADQTLIQNAGRDPAHPKWAVVPKLTACAWCVMIGSRGFVYKSDLTADAQRHNNCQCAIAVDFDTDNPSLKGDDPKALYERYQQDLANGTVTTSGSSIQSIGVKSGSGIEIDPMPQASHWGGGGVNKWQAQRIQSWTNDVIVMLGQAQDVGQLATIAQKVDDTWKRSGDAFTDLQVQGIKNAFKRAKNRLGVTQQQVVSQSQK